MDEILDDASVALGDALIAASPTEQLSKVRAAAEALARAEAFLLTAHPDLGLASMSPTRRARKSRELLPLAAPEAEEVAVAVPLVEIGLLKPSLTAFAVRATVASRSEVNRWTTARLSGKLFHVMLRDATGEIKATAFNEDVTELYGQLVPGKKACVKDKEYIISGAKLRPGKEALLEMTLSKDTKIQLVDPSNPFRGLTSPAKISRKSDHYSKSSSITQSNAFIAASLSPLLPRANPTVPLSAFEATSAKAEPELEIDVIVDHEFEFEVLHNENSPFSFRKAADADNTHIKSYYFPEAEPEAEAPRSTSAEPTKEIEVSKFFQKRKRSGTSKPSASKQAAPSVGLI